MVKLSLFLVAVVAIGATTASLRRVCYYTNWAQYRNAAAKFFPENVDPSLCTHVIYAFAKMVGNHLAAFEWNDESTDWMKGMYERFGALKKENPSIKLMLAVGGWNMGSAPFTAMAKSDSGRREFARTSIKFLRKNGFDGLDMDWEYPANRGSPPEDKHRFTQILQVLREEFDNEAVPAGKEHLLISAAVAAGKDKIDTAYEIPEISKLLDFINLMSYDLHGSWEDFTGHNSPLYSRSNEVGNQSYLNVDWAARYWVQKGAPKEMLNIGMGLYGRTFKLPYGTSNHEIGCPAKGAGAAGLFTREAGFMAYYEICDKLKNGGTKMYESEQKVPYMYLKDLWVGYDDPASLRLKVDYVKQGGFGGVMVWALDLDDFSNKCGEGKYPLMHAIIDQIGADPIATQSPSTAAPGQTNPPAAATTNNPIVMSTNGVVTTAKPSNPVTTAKPSNPVTTAKPSNPVTTAKPAPAPTQAPGSNSNMHQLTHVDSSEFDCSVRTDGYYGSPTSCTHYYVCVAGISLRTDCHPGLHFNPATLYCDFPDHVTCTANTNNAVQNTAAPAPVNTQPPAPVVTQQVWTTRAPVQTQPPTTQAPAPLPTNSAGHVDPADFCKGKADGFHRDPESCDHYYECYSGTAYHKGCSSGTYYQPSIKGCDWAANVQDCP